MLEQRAPIRRLLITAGPTQEPIDRVRYIGNRSSGKLGVALAAEAAERGLGVELLLGPVCMGCDDSRVRVSRFRTTAELEALLRARLPHCDALIMAAAVADFRPRAPEPGAQEVEKLRRSGVGLTLALDPTPDLLAMCAALRRPDQTLIGFALEPRAEMLASAQAKLERKNVDAIVANPLETMDAEEIEAHLIRRGAPTISTSGRIPKARFAAWLLDALAPPGRAPGGPR